MSRNASRWELTQKPLQSNTSVLSATDAYAKFDFHLLDDDHNHFVGVLPEGRLPNPAAADDSSSSERLRSITPKRAVSRTLACVIASHGGWRQTSSEEAVQAEVVDVVHDI
jgi:hypothetical protein